MSSGRILPLLASALLVATLADLPAMPLGAVDFARRASAGSAWGEAVASPCRDCSVILISIDTLRADHLGSYGYARPTSPNIDRFAEQAAVFSTAIAPAGSTLRSHASMFTSWFWFQHRASIRPAQPLSDEARTVAEVLLENGFETAAFVSGGQTAEIWGSK